MRDKRPVLGLLLLIGNVLSLSKFLMIYLCHLNFFVYDKPSKVVTEKKRYSDVGLVRVDIKALNDWPQGKQ